MITMNHVRSGLRLNKRPPKPRSRGLTEIRGPCSSTTVRSSSSKPCAANASVLQIALKRTHAESGRARMSPARVRGFPERAPFLKRLVVVGLCSTMIDLRCSRRDRGSADAPHGGEPSERPECAT